MSINDNNRPRKRMPNLDSEPNAYSKNILCGMYPWVVIIKLWGTGARHVPGGQEEDE